MTIETASVTNKVDGLQSACAEIAAAGGEHGAIAADIARVGRELDALCQEAELALGRC